MYAKTWAVHQYRPVWPTSAGERFDDEGPLVYNLRPASAKVRQSVMCNCPTAVQRPIRLETCIYMIQPQIQIG